jgi:hypothetical protein
VVACFGFQLVIIISNTVHRALCTVTHPPTRFFLLLNYVFLTILLLHILSHSSFT